MAVHGTNFHRLGLQKYGVVNRRSGTWSRLGGGRYMGFIQGSRINITNNYWDGGYGGGITPMYYGSMRPMGIWGAIFTGLQGLFNGLMSWGGYRPMNPGPNYTTVAPNSNNTTVPPNNGVTPSPSPNSNNTTVPPEGGGSQPVVKAVITPTTTKTETVTFKITKKDAGNTTGWDRILGSFTTKDGQPLNKTQRDALKEYLRREVLNDPSGNTFFKDEVILPKEITVGNETFVASEERYNAEPGTYWNWTPIGNNSSIRSETYTYSSAETTTYNATITTTDGAGQTNTESVTITANSETEARRILAEQHQVPADNIEVSPTSS